MPSSFGHEDAEHPGASAATIPSSNVMEEALQSLEVNFDVDSVGTTFEPQSGTTDDNTIMKIVSNETHQNVDFTSNDDPYLYSVKGSFDPTRTLQDTSRDDLSDFFSRPIKISTTEWVTNSALNVIVDPWSTFLGNPRVTNRMTNYNLLRARMRVKILINGNSFHYGRAMALYHPQHSRDDFTNLGSRTSLVQGSQMPHVFLDPTTSTGGELCLPFFCEKNNLNLPSIDYTNLGRIHIISLNDLQHANGAADKATVSIFAWLEDVELNMLTSLDVASIAPQMGLEIDEANSKGVVSGPATVISKIAASMSEAPVIGPFAMATSKFAGLTAGMAKLFGYSRPVVTKDPEPFKPAAISSLATTTVPDGAAKLTIDDKQELTIDPTISGIGPGDPLNICQIAKRESYLTTFNWDVGEAPETLLWNSRVQPTLWATEGSAIYLPACAMAALPFSYWTGTMKFRFQIVASAFHKGRIKIVYDPNFMSSNEYNTNYMEIIDMAEKQDFTIEIGIGQNTPLLVGSTPIGSPLSVYGGTPLGLGASGNGVLSVYVVNELTTPDTSAPRDVQVNVFISAGDDFEVFAPNKRFQGYEFKPQWGFEPQSGQEKSEVNDALVAHDPSPPQQNNSDVLGIGMTNHEDLNKVFIGEAIKSFRPLLKRYTLHSMLNATFNSDRRSLYGRRAAFPYFRGAVAGAVNATSTAVPYNYCNTLLLHWVTLAFSGYRGSIRWKIVPQGFFQADSLPVTQVERSLSTVPYQNGRTALFTPTSESQMAFQGAIDPTTALPATNKPLGGWEGMHLTSGEVNPNTEFEVPFYSPDRFIPGKKENYTGVGDILNVFDYKIFMRGNNESYINAFCAAGEDFQVYFWTGLPPVYWNPAPPSPSVT